MSNPQGGAPTPGQPVPEPTVATVNLDKIFGPDISSRLTAPPSGAVPAPAPAAAQADPAKPAAPAPAPEAPAVESEIAKALREMREDRAARDTVKAEAKSWQEKHDAVLADMAALKKAQSFEDDPISYIKARKWDPEFQKEIVQLLAYDLNPAAAPPDFRIKLFESKQARKDREAQEAQTQARTAAQAEQEQHQIQAYARGLDAAASSFSPGAFPANEDWYGENRTAYVTDLFNLANELAEEAQSKGQRADLSAEALAAALEQKNAAQLTALESRRGKRKTPAEKPADQVQPAGAKQSTGTPVSTHGLNQGGPRPPAMTEEERLERAKSVVFGTR